MEHREPRGLKMKKVRVYVSMEGSWIVSLIRFDASVAGGAYRNRVWHASHGGIWGRGCVGIFWGHPGLHVHQAVYRDALEQKRTSLVRSQQHEFTKIIVKCQSK